VTRLTLPLIRLGIALLLAGAMPLTGGSRSFAQSDTPNVFQEIVRGLLGRTVFKTEAGKAVVEITDLLVGPGKASEAITLKGGALLDVQGGESTLLVDGKARRVRAGDVVSLAKNQSIAIDNSRAQRSLVARLIVISRPDG
jgi:hypothetical protein